MKTIEQLKNDFVKLSKEVTDLLTSYTLENVSFERPCGDKDIFVYFPDRIHVIWDPEEETQGYILFWGDSKDFTLQKTDVIRLKAHISKLYAQLQECNE